MASDLVGLSAMSCHFRRTRYEWRMCR